MTNTPPTAPIAWHCLLGEVLEKLLSPVGLLVYTELSVMTNPPKADILIIRRTQVTWTESQRQRLPDGLRDSPASHLLLEFKYTPSLTGKASRQALAYDHFYKEVQELTDSDVQTVLLCAKQPQADHLTQYGYLKTSLPGVYQSDWPSWLPPVLLLSLNELSNAPHNAWVKCFASQLKEKRQAFEVLRQLSTTDNFPDSLVLFLTTLWKHWFPSLPCENMKESTLTPEAFNNLSQHWNQLMLATFTVDDMLPQFPPDEVLARFPPEYLENYLTQLKSSTLTFEEFNNLSRHWKQLVLRTLTVDDMLAQFQPDNVLARFDPKDLENYLTHLNKSSRPTKAKAKPKR